MKTWTVQPLAATMGADIAICEGSDIVAIMHHDPTIQTEDDPDGDTVVWSPEDMRRARLMAAAPEMYQLLEYLGGSEEPFSTRDRLRITELLARVRGAE